MPNDKLLEKDEQGVNVSPRQLVDWSFKFISIILLPLMIWIITLLISVDKRVAIIEKSSIDANQVTEMRGDIGRNKDYILELQSEIADLKQCQTNIRLNLPCR